MQNPTLLLSTATGRSREGAWIEMSAVIPFGTIYTSRSREGAWIEIHHTGYTIHRHRQVAPARERGLKSLALFLLMFLLGRSREGAWIEIGCSLAVFLNLKVAPARERGLKFESGALIGSQITSLPRGSVD